MWAFVIKDWLKQLQLVIDISQEAGSFGNVVDLVNEPRKNNYNYFL